MTYICQDQHKSLQGQREVSIISMVETCRPPSSVYLNWLNLFTACDDAIWRHETILHGSGTKGVNQKGISE